MNNLMSPPEPIVDDEGDIFCPVEKSVQWTSIVMWDKDTIHYQCQSCEHTFTEDRDEDDF